MKRCGVLCALQIITLILPGAASAHRGWPYHALGGGVCFNGGVIHVYPPKAMRPTRPTDYRNPERVEWQPTLYRWDGRVWRLAVRGPYYYAYTTTIGLIQPTAMSPTWHLVDDPARLVRFQPFDLGAGTWRVRQNFRWSWRGPAWHAHIEAGRCTNG